MPQAGPRTAAPSREAFPSRGGAACQPGAWWLELCLRKNKKALRKAALCTSPALRGEWGHPPWSCWGPALCGARCSGVRGACPACPLLGDRAKGKVLGTLLPPRQGAAAAGKALPCPDGSSSGPGLPFYPCEVGASMGPPSSGAVGGGGTGCLYPGEGIGGSERGRRGGAGCQALTMSIQLLGGLLCTETQQKPWARGGRGCPSAQGAGAGGAPSAPCRRGADTGAEPPEHSLKPTRGVVKQEL